MHYQGPLLHVTKAHREELTAADMLHLEPEPAWSMGGAVLGPQNSKYSWIGVLNPMSVNPQEDLAELYRGHDAFLFTSRYEAWGMPVMEAMASGLAVVATRCLGVATFAQHAQNCLLADPQVPPHTLMPWTTCALGSWCSAHGLS
jgi:glycosyltransferase involved in cell wall biosynthesis